MLTFSVAAPHASAQELQLPLTCSGTDPMWEMTVTEDVTTFDYISPREMEIALQTHAEGADWPIALTMIGRGYTAIVLLEQAASCPTPELSARVLAQRGETPVLLLGCCEAAH